MGYSSDVRSVIYGPADQIDALVAAESMRGNVWFVGEFKAYLTRRKGVQGFIDNGYDALEINDNFSWDEDLSDVWQWGDMLARIDTKELPFNLAWEFVRIGEGSNDVQRDHGGEPDMIQHVLYPTIQIMCDWD